MVLLQDIQQKIESVNDTQSRKLNNFTKVLHQGETIKEIKLKCNNFVMTLQGGVVEISGLF